MTPKIEENFTSNNEFDYLNNINKVSYGCYLNLLNDSDITIQRDLFKLTPDRTFETHLGIICAVLAVLNIICNTAFIFGLIKTNKKLSNSQKLFLLLSCIDLIAGFCVFPMLAVIHGFYDRLQLNDWF